MSKKEQQPNALFLLDNSTMVDVLGDGEFTIKNMTFEETKAILDTFVQEEIYVGFSNSHIEHVIFGYLGIGPKNYAYREIGHLNVGQEAQEFKLYVTESETQPVIYEGGVEAKKIENIYVYCQYLTRTK